MIVFLRKDKIKGVKFSQKEYSEGKLYMQSQENWRVDGEDDGQFWGPNKEGIGFASDYSQIYSEDAGKEVLEGLIKILLPKYYLDGSATRENFIPISELFK